MLGARRWVIMLGACGPGCSLPLVGGGRSWSLAGHDAGRSSPFVGRGDGPSSLGGAGRSRSLVSWSWCWLLVAFRG